MTEFEITTLIMGISAIVFAIWVKPNNTHHTIK